MVYYSFVRDHATLWNMEEKNPTQADEKAVSTATEQPILVWEAKEFEEYSRNRHWYVVVGVIGILLVVGSLFFRQWLAAVVFALATYVVLQHADDKPRQMTYSISKLGVTVGNTFHPYNSLRMFWLIYKPPVKTLNLQTVNRFKPWIKIDLADVDPLAVRTALRDYLPEDTKREEDFLDKFSRFIRL